MTIAAGVLAAAMMAAPTVDENQQQCLALNIYHEARGERVEGQIAVAHVTVNRVEHDEWPSTICDVVYEPKQFSWTHLIKDHAPTETKAWNDALIIARDVMIGNTDDPTYGAVFYHANYVNPSWAEYTDLTRIIGRHLFYTWDGDWNANN
jgi:spore germination cell wall hydrolase CwlJ-like protein